MDRREQLLEVAGHLFRRHGYAAFSYADLAGEVGIRKASIHHHFPTKDHLAEALILDALEQNRQAAEAAADASARDKLQMFFGYYRALLEAGGEMCMGGAIASDVHALGERGAAAGRRYLRAIRQWLRTVVAELGATPDLVRLIMASLQGGLQNARALDDPNELLAVIEQLEHQVLGE